MSNLYNLINGLCAKRGITVYRLCKETGVQPSVLTDLKMGRQSGMSAKNLNRIAVYFGVSIGYLLGDEDAEVAPSEKSPVYDDEAWEMMREMYERPELRALFQTTKRVKPEDIKMVDDLLKRMAGGDEDDN